MEEQEQSNPASAPSTGRIILYGRSGCGSVGPIRRVLDEVGAAYDYVDIYRDPEARSRVRDINHGNESVPTLLFPDGSTLTEPTLGALQARLREMGQAADVSPATSALALLSNPLLILAVVMLVLLAAIVLNS